MYSVTLQPLDQATAVPPGTPLVSALLAKKLSVAMSCGGKGVCATCHVKVRDGADALSEVGPRERRTLALVADADGSSRLACQAAVVGDGAVVEVPAGMYLQAADDLLGLLGERAPQNILHPIRGQVLIPKGKIVTRTLLEQSRGVDAEVRRMKAELAPPAAPARVAAFAATGSGVAPRPVERAGDRRPPAVRPSTPLPEPRVPPAPKLSTADLPTPPDPPRSPSTAAVSPIPTPRLSSIDLTLPSLPDAAEAGSSILISKSLTPTESLPGRRTEVIPGAVSRRSRPLPGTGDRVGRYLLLDRAGAGGLGVVYRALHTTLNITVAVKFLRAPGADRAAERLRSEARLLAQLNHPSVVRVLDFEDDPELPFVVMEFVEGLSLVELLAQSGRVRADRAAAILAQAADGLDAAWKLGIAHRDVKPGNILVARDGTAKLADFGLAVRLDGASTDADPRIDGTVAYLCPERARDPGAADHRADIYALGVTFFQLVTGRLPYAGTSAFDVMAAHAVDPIPDARAVAPDVSPEASAVIRRMMAKRPEDRYAGYDEVRAVLAGLAAPVAT